MLKWNLKSLKSLDDPRGWPFNSYYRPQPTKAEFLNKFQATLDKYTEQQNVTWVISGEEDE